MARRDRERKPSRRNPFRNPKPVILIVCEGRNTEPDYFEGLVSEFRNPRVDIELVGGKGTPKTLVAVAKEYREKALSKADKEGDENLAYDDVWCVFDRDDHLDIPDAFQMARDNGIQIAFSNPCFELWLLLHFRDQPGMKHRDAIITLVKEEIEEYDTDSKHVDINKFINGYSNAIQRSKRLSLFADDQRLWDRNPYTDVHKLTILITSPAT